MVQRYAALLRELGVVAGDLLPILNAESPDDNLVPAPGASPRYAIALPPNARYIVVRDGEEVPRIVAGEDAAGALRERRWDGEAWRVERTLDGGE